MHLKKQFFILLFLFPLLSFSQMVSEGEYFWDTDPGPGLGNVISISSPSDSVNFTLNISTSSLSLGQHYLYIRTRNSFGKWSLSERRSITITPVITAAEYFWDTDPGIGLANLITIGVAADSINIFQNISTGGLISGIHKLYIRTKKNDGKWSLSEPRTVTVLSTIIAAEYFWDTDPGIGLANAIIVGGVPSDSINFSQSISTIGLTAGNHILYLRTKKNDGKWSLSEPRIITVNPAIIAGEYFWDTDPGPGFANPITIAGLPTDSVNFTQSISTTGLASGIHRLYVRTKKNDGKWSLSEPRTVNIISAIVAAEYFWDTDPGIGLASSIAISGLPTDSVNLSQSISTTGLTNGLHRLYVRTKDSNGKWSISEPRAITIRPTIIAAEYFWNTDPGQGLALSLALTGSPTDSINFLASIPTTNMSPGVHNLYTRTKNNSGVWSLTEKRTINILSAIVAVEYFWNTDPGNGLGTALPIAGPASDSLNYSQSISTTGLSDGINFLYVRTKTHTGVWSLSERRAITIRSTIISAEYFWDTDPGHGLGNAIAITSSDSINVIQSISTTGLSNGSHILYIRTKSNSGKWSLSEPRTVIIKNTIVAAEYFWDTDPGLGLATAVPAFSSTDSLNTSFFINTSALSLGTHQLYTRAKDRDGKWSLSERRTVYVGSCTSSITANGPVVFCQPGSVTLTSSAGSSYQWSNGQTSGSITVNTSGAYSCSVLNFNGCTSISNTINVVVGLIPQITSFTPSSGAAGSVITVYGSGFSSANNLYFNNTASVFTIINDGIIDVTVPGGATSGPLQIFNSCGDTFSSSSFTVIPSTITLSIGLTLQGFAVSPGMMRAALGGTDVDTVRVLLASAAAPYNFVDSVWGILKTNGDLNVILPSSVFGDHYYIVIHHRNTLETWSSFPVVVNNSAVFYDFYSSNQAFGNNLAQLPNGQYALWSGDIDQNRAITFFDLVDIEDACANNISGYRVTDITGDNICESADFSLIENNFVTGPVVIKP
jgi:hypothetical protein